MNSAKRTNREGIGESKPNQVSFSCKVCVSACSDRSLDQRPSGSTVRPFLRPSPALISVLRCSRCLMLVGGPAQETSACSRPDPWHTLSTVQTQMLLSGPPILSNLTCSVLHNARPIKKSLRVFSRKQWEIKAAPGELSYKGVCFMGTSI